MPIFSVIHVSGRKNLFLDCQPEGAGCALFSRSWVSQPGARNNRRNLLVPFSALVGTTDLYLICPSRQLSHF